MANVFEPEWAVRPGSSGLSRTARVGAQAGAERLGATLYEIAPGDTGLPFHAHHANEEMIVVLGGNPTLRTQAGHRRLDVGEVVACPAGERGAHQLRNESGEPVRVLVISTMVYPEVVEMLDSRKILAISAPPGVRGRFALAFPRSARVDPLADEPGDDS